MDRVSVSGKKKARQRGRLFPGAGGNSNYPLINEIFTSKDVLQGSDLSHIKYLIAGNTCSLPRLQGGDLAAALRQNGVGIMDTSYREVPSDLALKRLREFINIFKNIEQYHLAPYYLPDIIDQRLDIPGGGTTNLGKLEYRKNCLFG